MRFASVLTLVIVTVTPMTSLADDDLTFSNGFADLFDHLGPSVMGRPLETEHPDAASGDIVQLTSTGLARYQVGALPAFYDGQTRYTWTPARGVVTWQDDTWTPPEPSVPSAVSFGVWDLIAECEAHGNWAAATGNNYWGGLQFDLGSWRKAGGSGRPDQNSRAEQIRVAQNWQRMVGWNAWPLCSRRLGLR